MSLTSCYKYILELPVQTLTEMLRAALSASDGSATGQWPNVPIGDFTASVVVRPDDFTTNPPSLDLLAVDLGVMLHLKMIAEIRIIELPELDPILYSLQFDLPGAFEKDTTSAPPVLFLRFPAVTAPALNLVVTGGAIPLTPGLFETPIHELYDSNPALGHTVKPNQPWFDLSTGPTTALVTVDIFDDAPGDMPYRGAITVQVLDATHINIKMPGHFKVQGISTTYMNTDMTVDVKVRVETLPDRICVKMSEITNADVTVTFAVSSAYDVAALPILQGEIANRLKTFTEPCKAKPTPGEVEALIANQLVSFASTFEIRVFTPPAPSGGDQIDLSTFVPTTVNQQVLALQLEPRGDGTICDTPDVFAELAGFAMSVADVVVNPRLQALVDTNNGSTREVQGHDVTVSGLSATLSNPTDHGRTEGHIWIHGMATAEVDCWADPEVEFEGSLTLEPILTTGNVIKVKAHAGAFGADDPCCGDVDPAEIAAVLEGDEEVIGNMPTNFTGVGTIALTLNRCDISTAGLVIFGGLAVTPNSVIHAAAIRKTLYWFSDLAGGG